MFFAIRVQPFCLKAGGGFEQFLFFMLIWSVEGGISLCNWIGKQLSLGGHSKLLKRLCYNLQGALGQWANG